MPQARTILLVEDEASVLRIAGRVLRAEGFKVLEAPSGAKALELLRRSPEPPALIVTDFQMPGLNGAELARKVRALWPNQRILCISGYCPGGALGPAGFPPDTAFLAKPFSRDELVETIRSVMEQ